MISNGLLAALIMIAIILLTGVLLNVCHCIARCVDGVPNDPGQVATDDEPHWILVAGGNLLYCVFCTIPCGLFCKTRNNIVLV